MSDNINSIKSSNETEENCEDQSYTLLELMELQKELEEESAAVLGGSDEKECTYEKGYIKRQALYSCLTCCPESRTNLSKAAGICLACSYQCHENHELIELYTKRNFRCDCPTERISQNKCTFSTKTNNNALKNQSSNSSNINENNDNNNKKFPENKENIYNQNFSGVYCVCKRPYPDLDDPIQDEMIQCVICEDWYHTRHLNSSFIPKVESYSEMICGNCMEKFDFLKDYTEGYSHNKIEKMNDDDNEKKNMSNDDVNVVSEGEDDKLKSELERSISDIMSISKNSNENDDKGNISSESNCNGIDNNEPQCKKLKLDESNEACQRPVGTSSYEKGGVFWIGNWRQNLCKCSECVKMYAELKIEYLLDIEDTVHFYEEKGLKKVSESDDNEKIINALSSMGRVQQIEAITAYNRMKDKLTEFLRTFVGSQKVVTEADIHEFFQKMKNEKNSNVGVPHFCR